MHESLAVNLKLLVLSDLHGDSSIIETIRGKTINEEMDALIVCGDITHFGNLTEAEKTLKELTGLSIPVLFVPGNCDPKELGTVQSLYGATNVHGRHKEIGSLHFLGIGGSSPTPFHTPFEMPENEMKRILYKAYRDANMESRFILVSHAPPANTKVDLSWSGIHAGSRAVREFIDAEKPSLVLCGHIHEARGKDVIDGTLIVNPGPARRGLYAIVDVNGDITVDLDVSQ